MQFITRRSRVTVTVLVATLAATFGIAYATWNATGTGTGTATSTSATGLTIAPASPAGAALYPGGTADLSVTFTNDNDYPVTITDVSDSAIVAVDGVACEETGVSFDDQSGLDLEVDANSTLDHTFLNSVHMNNDSDTGCQGETFTITLDLLGASSAP